MLLFGMCYRGPNEFYGLLRIVCCVGFLASYFTSDADIRVYYIVFVIIFNPILPIPFPRNVWIYIDSIVSGWTILGAFGNLSDTFDKKKRDQ